MTCHARSKKLAVGPDRPTKAALDRPYREGYPDVQGGALLTAPLDFFSSSDVNRLARELGNGRLVFRDGDGRKTYCPLCQSQNKGRKPRPTLSITARNGKGLFYCHRCRRKGLEIIRALVSLGFLPNLFRQSAAISALTEDLRIAIAAASWIGTGKTTDLSILEVLLGIVMRSRKVEFGASVREVAACAQISCAAAWRSMRRLVVDGWLENLHAAQDDRAAIWRVHVPKELGDRIATIRHAQKEGDRLLQCDPFVYGDRADRIRPVASFPHEVFRRGKGLGPIKGRVYALVTKPISSTEIATLLKYTHLRNVRVHIRALVEHGLIRRRPDNLFERCDVRLDEVAERLGVLGLNERQRARHAEEQYAFSRLCKARAHWMETGEVVDPENGAVLAAESRQRKETTLSDFRRALASARMTIVALSLTESVSQCDECSTKQHQTDVHATGRDLRVEESKQQTRTVRELRTDQ